MTGLDTKSDFQHPTPSLKPNGGSSLVSCTKEPPVSLKLVKMRIENHIYIRHIMFYHCEKSWNAAQSVRDRNELFGEETISKRQIERWFKKFKSSDTNFADEEGRDRPLNFNDQALLAAVEEDESLTRMLAEDFNMDHSTIVRSLKISAKYGNWLDGSPTNSPTTTNPNVSEFSPICYSEMSKLRS
ncbi:mariner mos1 transposase-like protein [Holotrichia oblita]|uniref:Mariner mos1 transposase-like protein n=1 Tax=Holotrichia oblita TaxID=644536 RepID=A0ACB9T1N1_HOLOL|nr:mariner mos1 transposase-like protein [Holotrichia oblita]